MLLASPRSAPRVTLTLAEAATLLHPPLTERQLTSIVRALPGITPAGYRHDGRPGHPVLTYDWARLCDLHAAITPFLADSRR